MNVLFVGAGQGSWQIRGVQMAEALGARATTKPSGSDWRWAEVIVLVKRAIDEFGGVAAACGVPIIWDVLDFWRQPEQNRTPMQLLVDEVHRRRDQHRVSLLLGATKQMAADIGGVFLPHHSRPGLSPWHVREQVEVIAYEGTPKYLGDWAPALKRVCADRGWHFLVNPQTLAHADIVVALRGGKWDGEVCRRWKSAVKAVNAIAVGRPVLGQRSAMSDVDPEGSNIDNASDLGWLLESLSMPAWRRGVAERCALRASEFTLATVSSSYRAILQDVIRRAA